MGINPVSAARLHFQLTQLWRCSLRHWPNSLRRLTVWTALALLSSPSISHANSSRCMSDLITQRDLHAAIRIYKEERGQLPSSLDQLHETGYLVSSPPDAWGRPYIYHLTENSSGYSLHSQGKNGRDEQGGGDDTSYVENRNTCNEAYFTTWHFLIAGGLAICIIAGLTFFTLRRKTHKRA